MNSTRSQRDADTLLWLVATAGIILGMILIIPGLVMLF